MKLPVVLAAPTGIALLAAAIGCSTTPPTEAVRTPNIDATVEARLAQERAVDATAEARAKKLVAAQATSAPAPTNTQIPQPTYTPQPEPTNTPTVVPTAASVPTPTARPLLYSHALIPRNLSQGPRHCFIAHPFHFCVDS